MKRNQHLNFFLFTGIRTWKQGVSHHSATQLVRRQDLLMFHVYLRFNRQVLLFHHLLVVPHSHPHLLLWRCLLQLTMTVELKNSLGLTSMTNNSNTCLWVSLSLFSYDGKDFIHTLPSSFHPFVIDSLSVFDPLVHSITIECYPLYLLVRTCQVSCDIESRRRAVYILCILKRSKGNNWLLLGFPTWKLQRRIREQSVDIS